jgi:hypothetical protein
MMELVIAPRIPFLNTCWISSFRISSIFLRNGVSQL